MLVDVLMAALATFCFSYIFNVPKKELLICGLTGGICWFCYLITDKLSGSFIVANLVSAVVLSYLSRCISYIRRTPLTLFLTPAIIPLVPGAGMYYTIYYMIVGDIPLSMDYGMRTLKIATAIVIGIVSVLNIPDSLVITKYIINKKHDDIRKQISDDIKQK